MKGQRTYPFMCSIVQILRKIVQNLTIDKEPKTTIGQLPILAF